MAWWLWPAGGEADLFYLVATRDSRRPGQMVYLDIFGVPRLWPFHPDTSDPMAEWKLVPADLASGVVKSEDDMPAYFIVSGSNQRYKNEMLFVRGEVGGAPLPPPPPLTFAPSPPPLLPPPLSETHCSTRHPRHRSKSAALNSAPRVPLLPRRPHRHVERGSQRRQGDLEAHRSADLRATRLGCGKTGDFSTSASASAFFPSPESPPLPLRPNPARTHKSRTPR